MSTAYAKNSFRNQGEIRDINLDSKPLCPGCHKPMAIITRKKVIHIGLKSTYTVSIPTYSCQHKYCSEYLTTRIQVTNPFAAPRMAYDYDVQSQVVFIRWNEHATYNEISERLDDRFEIKIDLTAIETVLKTYELACKSTYKNTIVEKLKEIGGLLVCIDVVEPLKGKKGVLVAYEYYTGITLGSRRLPNGKKETYEKFLMDLHKRIKSEIGVPILGIISDALPAQRKAIAKILKKVPHCLCHYHFYALVLKEAKEADSSIITELRTKLRKNYYIRQYSERKIKGTLKNSQFENLEVFFEPLEELKDWRRKPKDPCFSGTELQNRLHDLLDKFKLLQNKVNLGDIHLTKYTTKVIGKIIVFLEEILTDIQPISNQLIEIHKNLDELVYILSQCEKSATQGLKLLLNYIDELNSENNLSNRGEIYQKFVLNIKKYADTKGMLLFNYRNIPNAPTTNNFQELQFKQLKYAIRRMIGHQNAKSFFVTHGEAIVYVNPDESLEEIRVILENCNQSNLREEIKSNRRSLDSWNLVIHDQIRWTKKMNEIDDFIHSLEITQVARS